MTQHAFIVGGNSGIGHATVRRLMEQGWSVSAAVRHPDELAGLEIATQPFEAEADSELALPDVLHGLVYFPGTITLKPFRRLGAGDFRRDFEVNCLSAVRVIQQALPALGKAESASIVLFSTVAVETGIPFHASIAAAKGAVEGLARSLAAELAPGIRVNVIAPSLTDTPLAQSLLNSEAKREAAKDRHPLKRVGDPDDVARIVEFLLSSGSSFMTGQVLRPDGGLSSLRVF